jgi:hypothetical protein
MLYCDINDAYNINDKPDNNFDSNGNNSNSVDYLYWDKSKLSLDGTKLNNINNDDNDNDNNNNNNNNDNNNNDNVKLTHRDCINCYYNPKNTNYQYALNHIGSCNICKNEIEKNNKSNVIPVNYELQNNRQYYRQKNSKNNILSYLEYDKKEKIQLNNKIDNLMNYILNFQKNMTKNNIFDTSNKISIECNFINIAVLIIIVLLLLDIILRFKG